MVSSVGQYITEFETGLAKFTKAEHVIAIVNGTAALHLALHAVGVKPGDEVIVPTLSFVATANSVSHCGAIPHFVDSDGDALGLDPIALRAHLSATASIKGNQLFNTKTGRRISALVPMHTFGHPMQIAKLIEVANEFKLTIVLLPLKLITPHLPKVPVCVLPTKLPSDSAASSTIVNLNSLATSTNFAICIG